MPDEQSIEENIHRDCDEERETMQALKARVAELEALTGELSKANRNKGVYLANMSHEMRAPLNAINGFAELLNDPSFGEISPQQKKFVARIIQGGQHLLQLVNDVIDIAKLEAGRIELEVQPVNVGRAAEQAVMVGQGLARDRVVSVEPPGAQEPQMALADERRVKQVLLNLISNAAKYSHEASPIRVAVGRQNGMVRISVSDEGPGIAPEDQERIFEEFVRTKSATTQAEGAGLGLPLSRKLVQMHGGEIGVESASGEGSTFWFTLPVAPPPGEAAGTAIGDRELSTHA